MQKERLRRKQMSETSKRFYDSLGSEERLERLKNSIMTKKLTREFELIERTQVSFLWFALNIRSPSFLRADY